VSLKIKGRSFVDMDTRIIVAVMTSLNSYYWDHQNSDWITVPGSTWEDLLEAFDVQG